MSYNISDNDDSLVGDDEFRTDSEFEDDDLDTLGAPDENFKFEEEDEDPEDRYH